MLAALKYGYTLILICIALLWSTSTLSANGLVVNAYLYGDEEIPNCTVIQDPHVYDLYSPSDTLLGSVDPVSQTVYDSRDNYIGYYVVVSGS